MNDSEFLRGELSAARKEVKELQAELDLSDEINYDEVYSYKRENGFLICLVISMAIWIATS